MVQHAEQFDSQRLLEEVRREREQASLRSQQLEAARHRLSIALHNSTTFTAACSCRFWVIENYKTSHAVDQDAARLLVADRHAEHVLNMGGPGGAKVELGYGVRCTPMRITGPHGRVSTGMICGGRSGRKRCQQCKKNWSIAQCDYPTGGECKKCKGSGIKDGYNCEPCAGTGRAMCNKNLCSGCRAHKEPDEDYCLGHREQAGLGPAPLKRESCKWEVAPGIVNRKCLRESCGVMMTADDRVLFFPRRCRAMCVACGEEYLRISR